MHLTHATLDHEGSRDRLQLIIRYLPRAMRANERTNEHVDCGSILPHGQAKARQVSVGGGRYHSPLVLSIVQSDNCVRAGWRQKGSTANRHPSRLNRATVFLPPSAPLLLPSAGCLRYPMISRPRCSETQREIPIVQTSLTLRHRRRRRCRCERARTHHGSLNSDCRSRGSPGRYVALCAGGRTTARLSCGWRASAVDAVCA